ncbi:hypothetical protein GOBAR_DD02440 [Gossypium barbadense]|nr:hypothetical protein GOBAR_DD02440 [Gossypium barbadense]
MKIEVRLDVRVALNRRKKEAGPRREFLSDTNKGGSIKNCLWLGCFLAYSSEKGTEEREGSSIHHNEGKKCQMVIRVADIPDSDDVLSADSVG